MSRVARVCSPLTIVVIAFSLFTSVAVAQTTSFTYQGRLQDGGTTANGSYDFQFTLWDSLTGGTQQPQPTPITVTRSSVAVAAGTFTVPLDFGLGVFPGADRFLEISVRSAGVGDFATLSPRQQISNTPYSLRSQNATSADNALQLGGVAANQYVVTTDSRMSDARPPTSGSANYIQNQSASPQPLSSFNISNDGFVNGWGAVGTSNNTFLGSPARFTVVQQQSGQWAGHFGTNNFSAGNSFGLLLDAGTNNSDDAFRIRNQSGASQFLSVKGNGFVGLGTAAPVYPFHVISTTPGSYAAHIQTSGLLQGQSYGLVVSAGTSNGADTSLWARAQDGTSLLRVRGDGTVGIGTDTPGEPLVISRNFGSSTSLSVENTSSGSSRKLYLSNYGITGGGNYWSGLDSANTSSLFAPNPLVLRAQGGMIFSGSSTAEHMRITPTGNVGIGTTNPAFPLHVVASGDGQYAAEFTSTASAGQDYGVFIRAGSVNFPNISYPLWVENQAGQNILTVDGTGLMTVHQLSVAFIPGTGSVQACWSGNLLASCSSSLRYKTNIVSYRSGLDLIRKLRPITFDWKKDGVHDLGLAAEDVEKIDPLLVTYNKDGQVEGVKYDRVGVVLINAVKEQQAQISTQQKQIEALREALCSLKPELEVCKQNK
jgi:hypothetical protein